jgi:Transposase DDE domain
LPALGSSDAAILHGLTSDFIFAQRTPAWKQLYNKRAGIEGTISQGVRSVGLRRSRYRGLSKTHLQNVAIACAINMQTTRTSAFARLREWII